MTQLAMFGLAGAFFLLLIYKTSFHLVIITLLFFISLLIIFKAPTYKLWLLAVIVSEYSIHFTTLTALILLMNFYAANYTSFETVLGWLTLIIFLSPIIRAYLISRTLKPALEKAFQSDKRVSTNETKTIPNTPFTISKLFQSVQKIPFRTLTYATYDDTTLTLDFYKSTMTGKRPCVIVIHGGSWNAGNSKQLPELNSHLAQAGYHCAAINYRLAPRWQCPAPIEDTTAAFKYLLTNADELSIDKNNFVLLGRSAGGQIALLTAYTLRQSAIKGVIDFYGPADMIWGYMTPTNPFVMNSTEVLSKYVGGDYHLVPNKYVASSPIEFVDEKTVPTLLFYGLTDSLVFPEHGRRLSSKLQQNNVSHFLLELPWATHGFDYNLNGPGGQLSTFAIEHFLRFIIDGY